MSILVIDDFLDKNNFQFVKQSFMSTDFPWYYNNFKVSEYDKNILDFQFTHLFYRNMIPNSNYFSIIEPIILKIEPKALVRAKANMNPVTKEIYKYEFHTDVEFDCFTAVYYINSNNGYTEFENGEKIDSIENRICIFNSSMPHRGTSSTDEKVRCVLNLNYF